MATALREPPPPATHNQVFRGAYRRGFEACARGESRSSCPYVDRGCRSVPKRPTFTRGCRNYWLDGWDECFEQLPAYRRRQLEGATR